MIVLPLYPSLIKTCIYVSKKMHIRIVGSTQRKIAPHNIRTLSAPSLTA